MSRRRDEPVRLTRITTRGGDRGETSLGDGTRVAKTEALIGAIGSVDELNAVLGVALATELPERLRTSLERIQNELFDVGADLSRPPVGDEQGLRVTQAQISALERLGEELNAGLEPLRSFVLPGGGEAAARLQLARAVCRRAERDVLLAGASRALSPLVAVYLNRLSDVLFIAARAANLELGLGEPLWRPGESR
ncbi:MAG: cob(I)yrinic acid a,c-diamide adenosyltransferase [Gaiellaceae bacterium]